MCNEFLASLDYNSLYTVVEVVEKNGGRPKVGDKWDPLPYRHEW